MKKTYILVYSNPVGDRKGVKTIVDNMRTIVTWRYDLPNCFYLVSDSTAEEIAEEFRSKSDEQGRFIVSEIPSNSQGWLPDESWYLIQHHELKKK